MITIKSNKKIQNGSVLLVAMIFLILFSLIAASVYKSSISSVQALGNMQWRTESINAANDAIDKLLSDPTTFTNAATIGATVGATPLTFDVNGDGNTDVQVKFLNDVGPECKRAVRIPAAELDVSVPEDVACMSSGSSNNTGLGITNATGSTSGLNQIISLCANVEWAMTVQATDSVTNTSVNVVQGVGVRSSITSLPGCS
jgi:hypothetical protein